MPITAAFDLRSLWLAAVPLAIPLVTPAGPVRIAASDLLLIPVAVLLLRRAPPQAVAPRSHTRWVALFVAAVWLGNLSALVYLGHVTSWGLVNRGVGAVVLAAGYLLLVVAPHGRRLTAERVLVWFVGSVSVVNVLAVVGAIARYGFGIPNIAMQSGASFRLAGSLGGPNSYGGLLAVVLLLQAGAVAFGHRLFRLPRWVEPLNCLALLVALVLTVSRGSWLAALLGALALAALLLNKRTTWSLRLSALLAPATLALALTLVLAASGFGGLFGSRWSWAETRAHAASIQERGSVGFLEKARDASSLSERAAINAVALRLVRQSAVHALFGIGLGSFAATAPDTELGLPVQIHNSYLWALTELGAVGLLVLLGLLGCMSLGLIRRYLAAGTVPDWAGCSTLAALVSVGFWLVTQDGMFHRHIWVLLAVVSLLVNEDAARSAVPPAGARSQNVPVASFAP